MKLVRISVLTSHIGQELVADTMWELGSDGVSIADTNDIIELYKSDIIWDYIDEKLFVKSDIVTVCGFFTEEKYEEIKDDVAEALAELKKRSEFELGSLEIAVDAVNDDDWVNEWKKFYAPIDCGKILICPIWIKYDNKDNKNVVLINPGSAFGTGEHETTRGCLTLLGEIETIGKDVLDIGCGSGILAIAAKKCGAKSVIAYDIDEIAVKSCRDNAALNGLENDIEIHKADLIDREDITADIILANITADILIRLSEKINNHLRSNGILICSGIIHKRWKEVETAFIAHGLKLQKQLVLGEWIALKFTK